jgi:hypothetical protein
MENLKFNKIIGNSHGNQEEDAISIERRMKKTGNEEWDTYLEEKKTQEDLLTIKKFNEYIKKEMEDLGITTFPIEEDRIRFFSRENFEKAFPHSIERKSAGFYRTDLNLIGIKKTGLITYHRLMHEMVHYYSFGKFDETKDEDTQEPWKTGYHDNGLGFMEERFHDFNEGVVEYTTVEILLKNKKEIKNIINEFSDSTYLEWQKEKFFQPIAYEGFMDMLLTHMSVITGSSKEEIFKKFKKGLFSGNMMHLRAIEKAFGEKALRVLSLKNNENEYVDNLVYEFFFNFNDKEKQKRILKELQNQRIDYKLKT